MTRAEYVAVFRAIENVVEREKKYCKEYCKLNPSDTTRRERDRDLILSGLVQAQFELEKALKIYI